MMNRYLLTPLQGLVREKFVLLCGPRQVGKTTLAKQWLAESTGTYLNWDIPLDRETILKIFKAPPPANRLVLDEIHKYARWKNWLKGLYDLSAGHRQVLVTGSAKLDLYQRGGDSLLGRYELLRLHPLTMGEITHGKLIQPPKNPAGWLEGPQGTDGDRLWKQLNRRGGFPGTFLKDNDQHHRRWLTRRRQSLIHEDIQSLTDIKNLSLIEHLVLLLPERVGSPLSVNALREEIQTAHGTVTAWLDALEKIYYCFFVSPYSKKISRSLKKERKLYLWDWSEIQDSAARFENMVASHLLQSVHLWNDLGYGNFDLFYWRDKQKREVDFVVTNQHQPVALIECKTNQTAYAETLGYLASHLPPGIPQIQLVEKPGQDFRKGMVRIVSASRYLAGLS